MPLTARGRRETGRVSVPLWYQPSGTQGAWEEIARSVLGSAASSISFQSIPTDYRMFRLEVSVLKDGTANTCDLTLNNDTGANYDVQDLKYSNTTNGSVRATGEAHIGISYGIAASSAGFYSFVFGKPLAASEATGIGRLSLDNAAGIVIGTLGFVWNNTADLISRVDFTALTGNLDTGSVAVLYGNKY